MPEEERQNIARELHDEVGQILAAHVRGTVRIESTPGRGTRVNVDLPARPQKERTEADG